MCYSACRKHPRYKAILRPRVDCLACWEMWKESEIGKTIGSTTVWKVSATSEDESSRGEVYHPFREDNKNRGRCGTCGGGKEGHPEEGDAGALVGASPRPQGPPGRLGVGRNLPNV